MGLKFQTYLDVLPKGILWTRGDSISKKTFDCVEMKRYGASQVQLETAGMTREEELKYWRQATEELRRIQQEMILRLDKVNEPEVTKDHTLISAVC